MTSVELQALSGRLAAQDFLIGQLQAIVLAAGLVTTDELATMIDQQAKAAKASESPHLAMILSARAAAVRASGMLQP